MNICFASLSYPVNGETTSGVATQIELLAQALGKSGHAVSVVDQAGNEPASVSDDGGVRIYRMNSGRLHWFAGKLPFIGNVVALPLREIEYSLAAWRGARRAMRAGKLDLIEGTETGMLFVTWLLKDTPSVIRLHGEQYTFLKYTPGSRLSAGLRLTRKLQRLALRRAKLLISPSTAHAREIEKELGSVHPPIVVIPNTVRTETVRPDLAAKRDPRTVMYVGRIEERKGIASLLEAWARVKQALPETRFVIAGGFHSSFSETRFETLMDQFGLRDDIKLLGSVDWKNLTQWYQRATVCVLPSFYETFGLAALEPMTFGTPVIATTAGALPEVVDDHTGRLVPPGDAVALASAMIELLSNPGVYQQMSIACRQRAATFDIERILPVNEKLYRWACTPNEGEAGPHVFLSPHADDVVLSCGGLIHSLISRKKAVEVISVFAGDDKTSSDSAFARHLHRKWGLKTEAVQARWEEDSVAMETLGVTNFERWNYSEAPYRKAANDKPLYSAYDEMMGPVSDEDRRLEESLVQKLRQHLKPLPETAVIYCPLALGDHVDHRVVFEVGLQLGAAGKRVRFYEDYPYAASYQTNGYRGSWLPTLVPVDPQAKENAATAYASQLHGLGGSSETLAKRLRKFGISKENGQSQERYWELMKIAESEPGERVTIKQPLVRKESRLRLRDFGAFLKTFKWHDIDEALPAGTGRCLDVGCGTGRHRALIETRGYTWFGLDRCSVTPEVFSGSAEALPLSASSMSALVASQVLEYVEQPELVFAEAARVLEPGGVICGSASFLEPVHGRTYYNLSPLILEQLLRRHGFADIQIKPGLNGFALMLWTWLGRSGIPFAKALAIPLAFATLVPFAAILFFVSWVNLRLGFGTAHAMDWLVRRAPLDFAGHLIFVARKKARLEN